ncbi:MAG TPA: YbaB/EbfC family nucleoid-associated protein [Dehalococcoidia bacterium]|nr:YbaB/EbfC family nucleoid-associated protein [Dehalococcoidia bacterium]
MNENMLKQLAQMQERLQKAQEEIENRVAEATAGGGAVKVEITGGYRVKSLKIEPDAVDPDDVGMLEDLIIAAVNEALQQVQAFHSQGLGALTGGLEGALGGLGIPGLAGGQAPGGGAPLPVNRAARRASKR